MGQNQRVLRFLVSILWLEILEIILSSFSLFLSQGPEPLDWIRPWPTTIHPWWWLLILAMGEIPIWQILFWFSKISSEFSHCAVLRRFEMYLKAINPFLNAQVHITHQKSYLVAKYFIDTFSLALTTKILVSLLAISSSFCRNFTSGTFQNLYFTFVGKFLIFSKMSIKFLKKMKSLRIL